MSIREFLFAHPVALIVLPAVAVWIILLVDIATSSRLAIPWRICWMIAITIFFPLGLIWLLIRPSGGFARQHGNQVAGDDPGQQLIDLISAHERGAVSGTDFTQRFKDLTRHSEIRS